MSTNIMILVGLDISTNLGWAYSDGASGLIKFKKTTAPKKRKGKKIISYKKEEHQFDRWYLYARAVLNVMPSPDQCHLFIEGYSFASRGMTPLIELVTIIKAHLYNNGYTWTLIPPTSLKKFITGKGVADKDMMQSSVMKKWELSFDDDNQCDAYCLAKMGEHILNKKA